MAGKIGRFLKRLFIGFFILLFVLIVSIVGLMYIGVTVNLDFLKDGVETAAQSALGREVAIDGPVTLEFSTQPAVEVQGVQLANVDSSSEPVFFRAGRAHFQISVFPLLKRKIEIEDITAEDVVLNLENSAEGTPNWEFGSKAAPAEIPSEKSTSTEPAPTAEKEPLLRLSGVTNLTLKNIAVNYHDAALNKNVDFNLEALQGSGAPGNPLVLDLKGDVQNRPYNFTFNGESIEQLLARGEERAWQFTLEGDAVGKQIAAEGGFVKDGTESQADLGFKIDDIDVGLILSTLGLVEGLEASTGTMGVKLTLKGKSLNEILQKSSMTFAVSDAKWKIASPTSDAFLEVDDLNGDISVKEGNKITMNLAGAIGTLPVKFVITGAPLVDYVIDQESIPLTVEAEFADSLISFGGELALPVTALDLSLFFKFKTENLTNLNDILQLELPPVGPIAVETNFQLIENKYEMPELSLQVGDSLLAGNMSLDVSGTKPQMNMEFISELIQLDDFEGLAEVLPETKNGDTDESENAGEDNEKGESQPDGQTTEQKKNLLSKEILSSFDANLLVKAEQVLSGEDKLGMATLNISVQDSLLSVDPLEIEVPGGGVSVNMDYLPEDDGITVNLDAEIEDFDIGVLVRRSKPESDMGGLLFLDAALHSQSPDLSRVMEYAEGHFDFGLVPENFSAGIIDLWAVNLISSIMSEVSEEEKSEINCAVVRFGIEDGIMAEKAIYMDTSNMRIAGKADVDFKNRTFKVIMAPKAKRPEFFSLAVPIKVDGTFEDFGFGIGMTRLTGAVVSFITSPVHVPIRRVFADEIPEDGVEACRKAWKITGEEDTSTVQ